MAKDIQIEDTCKVYWCRSPRKQPCWNPVIYQRFFSMFFQF